MVRLVWRWGNSAQQGSSGSAHSGSYQLTCCYRLSSRPHFCLLFDDMKYLTQIP